MKTKITILFIILISAAGVTAQTNTLQPRAEVAATAERLQSQERGQTSEWYNYGQAVDDMGGNVSYFRNYLFPDSTVVFEGSTGMSSVWKHSLGQVLDPTSANLINNTTLAATDAYTLDSVRFWYRYFRFQTGAPDTVVVQIYNNNHITFAPDPWGTGVPYARVAYNYLTRKGSNADYEYTLLLSDADTAMAAQRALELPVNVYVPAGEKIAVTITYFPGNPFNVGDTIDAYMATPPVNLINAFVIYDFRDNDKMNDPLKYNNELNASQEVRYNISTNGWNAKYIPGTAWNAGFYHLDVDFKVTTDPISVNEIEPGIEMVGLSPNPATNQFTISDLRSTILNVEIYNMIGEKVYSYKPVTGNQKPVTINVSQWNNGIYFVKLKTPHGDQTQKLMVHH